MSDLERNYKTYEIADLDHENGAKNEAQHSCAQIVSIKDSS